MEDPTRSPSVDNTIRAGGGTLEIWQIRRLEVASVIEATTLILLVFVAVPLKHLAHWPSGVRVLGPIHGLAFAAYLWTIVETVAGSRWRRRDVIRILVAAFIPFGGYANIGFLSRRATALGKAR